MCREILRAILTSLNSLPNASFTFDDIGLWPVGVVSALEGSGILKRGGTAQTVTCDGCENACVEDVEFSRDGEGSVIGYVVCRERDDIGRVRIAPERLRTWEINPGGLAAFISRQLGEEAEDLLPGRLWLLGTIQADGTGTDLLLARGLGWPDGDQILRNARSRTRGRPAVLVVPTPTLQADSFETVPLADVLRLDEEGLAVDAAPIRQAAERARMASGRYPQGCRYLFRKGVDTWVLVYDGNEVSPPLKNSKGLHYLAFLLANPGRTFHALQIVHEVDGKPYDPNEILSAMSAEELEEQGLSVSGFTDAGDIMDDKYEADVRRQIKQLEKKLDLAKTRGDQHSANEIETELGQYRRALAEGIGRSGRHRSFGNAPEKARVAVTQAIKRVLNKLNKQHPALYQHLAASVRTGTECTYNPTTPIDWEF
jgi:hypothetical protein